MYENLSDELLDFLWKSPTAFHVIANVRQLLTAEGYTELSEQETWKLEEGGRYFTVRNESSIIAFRIPSFDYQGFMIAASHSDSPSFKIKANPEMKASGVYVRLNVEKYGGMLMAPWFDRPLSVAGRVIVSDGNGSFETHLVNVDRDLCMLPSLAIHMNREANDGFKYNAQVDMLPLFGDETAEGRFWEIIAGAAGVPKDSITGHDLFLYVREHGSHWGASNEYIAAGHLDDLQCSFADLTGFIDSGRGEHFHVVADAINGAACVSVPILAIFDNEEVGSGTKQGADSTFLSDILSRINEASGRTPEGERTAAASSFMISADNAHAIHPAHPEKADPVNRPAMNHGIVIKYHAGQKYTTDAVSAAIFKEICRRADVPFQEFTNRSDMNGGSTLGNISNAHVSLNTVDVGLAQLAMHSPYESAGAKDTAYLAKAAAVFFGSVLTSDGQGQYRLQQI